MSGARDVDLPPSAGYVLDIVERKGPVAYSDLVANSYLKESTAYDGLVTLEEEGLIERHPPDADSPRQSSWALRDSE